jgi:hypothetical protein
MPQQMDLFNGGTSRTADSFRRNGAPASGSVCFPAVGLDFGLPYFVPRKSHFSLKCPPTPPPPNLLCLLTPDDELVRKEAFKSAEVRC